MKRYACCGVPVLVAVLAASPGWGAVPVIADILYEDGHPGMLEDAGWADGGSGGRHVTILLTTATAISVTEVYFNLINVNDITDPAPIPLVDKRFNVDTDRAVDVQGSLNTFAIRVEVPPRCWPLDTKTRNWKEDIPVVVVNADGQSAPFNDFHYLKPIVVEDVLSDSYIRSGDTSILWDTLNIPVDEIDVIVNFNEKNKSVVLKVGSQDTVKLEVLRSSIAGTVESDG